MKNIIEKLGINTPDEIQLVKHCYEVFKLAGLKKPKVDDLFQEAKQLKKILDQRNELLENEVENLIALENIYENENLGIYGMVVRSRIDNTKHAIKKTDPQHRSWEKIKELFNA